MNSSKASTAGGEAPVLGERAKRRLRIAAALLRGQGISFDVARDRFYPHLLAVIEAIPEQRRLHLSSLVDWVEEYEAAGDAAAAPGNKPPGAAVAENLRASTPPRSSPNSTIPCSKPIEQGEVLPAPAGPGPQPPSTELPAAA